MAKSVSVSFKENENDLLEWADDQVENGPFRSRSGVIVYALSQLKDQSEDVKTLT